MPLWVKTILKYILYFEKFYGIIKVRKKYIDNICPPKPFRAIKKIHFIIRFLTNFMSNNLFLYAYFIFEF